MFEKYLNKLEEKITHISGSNVNPEIFSFEWMLTGISYLYGFGVWLRLWLYQKGILKQKELPCFVISIGNIMAGGVGKTPMAIYLTELLIKMGKRPVVISRGYKGNYKKNAMIVSNGEQIFLAADISGDEPYMMAQRKAFPVVVGRDRYTAGMMAIEHFNPDVIILDDGFQHLKLKRDLDFLLMDYSNPLGNKRFLPAGRLRETPQMSAQRADALIFTRSPDKDESNKRITEVLQLYPDCPWFKTAHVPFIVKQMSHAKNSKEYSTDITGLKGKKAVLFSGIANNASFLHVMKASGVNVLDHLEFKDHYRYKEPDILMINRAAKKVCADVILTTEKDWAKLNQAIEWELDLIVIGIQIEVEDSQRFESFLNSKLQNNE